MRAVRLLFVGLQAVGVLSGLPAQQMPYFNQYQWMSRLFNPAAQGFDGQGQITAAYQQQFLQLEADVRPHTYLLHVDLSSWMPERVGFGLQLGTDRVHLLRQTQGSGFFSYRLVESDRWRLALGLSASVCSYRFDLNASRLNDAADLSLLQGAVNRMRFDGGPGLALEYRTGNHVFALDAAANQLFTGQINLAEESGSRLLYRTISHLKVNARYRYQGAAFALEPLLMIRAAPNAMRGAFDVQVNAYFLEEDRLMVGAGLRSNGGGLRGVVGFAPFSVLRLVACAELHRALGASYELGLSIALRRFAGAPPEVFAPPAPVNLVHAEQEAAAVLAQSFEFSATLLQQRYEEIAALLQRVDVDPSPKNQTIAADSCALLLAQGESELQQMRQALQALTLKERQAQTNIQLALNDGAVLSAETREAMRTIEVLALAAREQLGALTATYRQLSERCRALRTQRDEAACVRIGDGECIQALFQQALRQTPGLSEGLFSVRTFTFPGAVAITYHFPDDDDSYALEGSELALAQHVARQVRRMSEQGLFLDNITLVTELQEDRSTLTYEPGAVYDGTFGNQPLTYQLVDNETAAVLTQTQSLASGAALNLETLAALKMAAWKAFFLHEGIPETRILLQVRYNHAENSYREETKVIVKLRS